MDKKIALWIAIGILFVVALFLVFSVGSVSYESVNTIKGAASASSYGGMVGGC